MQASLLTPRFALLLLLLGTAPLAAQITLTSAYFPEVGDSLLTNQATDAYRDGITFQPPGENLTWDFGTPELRTEFTEVLEAVTNDTFFVDATARLTSAAFAYEYYQRTDTAYNLVGLVGTLPFLRDTVLATRLTPPRPVKRANITYGDRFASTSVRELRISIDSLPQEIKNGVAGPFLAIYDTLRVVNTSVRTDEIDAYGTLTLNGKEYEVLREKRVEQLDTRVYLKADGGEFNDVTQQIKFADPSSGQFLGQLPEQGTYYFWAQGVKEPIVEIEFDEDENPTTFVYIRGERNPTTSLELPEALERVSLRPNPVRDAFTLSYTLTQATTISAALYDTRGQRVWQWPARYSNAGPGRLEGDVATLAGGVYYLQLQTSGGQTVRRLVKQ
ncbi:putative secreted protein (Por secretion system target) [Neolewinella xylanilytica]|uniref:Putative secreted protein (Por secretion system target) n=1 Tax=Neolewinella xylanilytica TaxID=1514080 RepID=A0A2S6I6X3_9BACT|nr:T9SS type A sorting domain-containing protein [Neolewinella xylanilytica]PPK87230.1 putative secreted protein (Por secretion system target) [Neolewinella xylanilytica]